MQTDYVRWNVNEVADLVLNLVAADGGAAIGLAPEVSIRRFRSSTGAALDGFWWNGTTFVNSAQWLPLVEHDQANNPGLYRYAFAQPGVEQTYLVEYRHLLVPVGYAVEQHIVELDPDTLILAGARQVDAVVRNQLAVPIPSVQVDVFTAGGAFLFRLTTNVAGQVSFAVNDGTYHVRLVAPGYSFTSPTVLVVDGAETPVWTGTSHVPSPPADPTLCVVWGTLRDAGGVIVPGADVSAYAITPQAYQGSVAADPLASTTTDEAGYFELPLVRTAIVRLVSERAGLDEQRTVPDTASQDMSTWTA